MISIIFIVAFILISSFITGRLVNYLFFKSDKDNTWLGFGFFTFLGLLQPILYLFVLLSLPTKFLLIAFMLLPLVLLIISIYLKVNLYPSKNDIYASIVGIIILTIGLIRIQSYTLGEAYFDSTFYLSMVNENSIKPVYGRMNFYSGEIHSLFDQYEFSSYRYDFTSFYALFSMLLKLVRNLNISEVLQTPIYFYSSTITFLYFFGVTLYTVSKRFLNKKSFILLLTTISSFLFFKYYNYAFAFIGNSYRVISISYVLLLIYDFFHTEEKSTLLLIGILLSGLIAVSSSGAFISLFILVSLIVYLIFKNYDKELITYSLYAFIPTLIYLLIIVYCMNIYVSIILLALIILYYFINHKLKDNDIWYKLHKFIIVFVIILMYVSSYFIQLNSKYPYSYFFSDHSAYDMVHDYFTINQKNLLYPNLVVWFVILIYFFIKPKNKNYKCYLITIIILFLNPLVIPFIINFLTDFVFYRAFEIIFNITNIAIFINSLSSLKNKHLINTICIIGSFIIIPFSYLQFSTNYAKTLIPTDDYNPYYRITNQELDLYNHVNEVISKEPNRVKMLSQIPSTKGYINNIELAFSVYETRIADQYAKIKNDAPSELMNVFFLRDYMGQEIYSTPPKYDMACDLLLENDIKYIIMKKNQAIDNEDGTFTPLYLNLRAVADIIYENDDYAFMKVRY